MPDYTSFRRNSVTSNRSYTSVREKIEEEEDEEIFIFESNLDHFEDAEKEIFGTLEMQTIKEEVSITPVNAP